MESFGDMIINKLKIRVKTMDTKDLINKYKALEKPIDNSQKDIEVRTKLQNVFLNELKERESE